MRFDPNGGIRWSEQSWDGMMRWRLDGGCTLRVRHAQMGAFPRVKLHRHPNNWGYVFHSPWVVYTSFPMSKATDDRSLSDRSLSRSVEAWQWREATAFNDGAGDSESESDSDGPPEFPEAHLPDF